MKIGNKKSVSFRYRVTDTEDNLLGESEFPVGYIHGVDNEMLPKLERAMKGKSVGDEVTVTMEPDEHFGDHNPELRYSDDIENVPEQYQVLGAEAIFKDASGEETRMSVVGVTDDKVYFDGNHPFAGKTVVYTALVLEIKEASENEIATGLSDLNAPYVNN